MNCSLEHTHAGEKEREKWETRFREQEILFEFSSEPNAQDNVQNMMYFYRKELPWGYVDI